MFLAKKYKFHNPLLEALPEPAYLYDLNGKFQSCNQHARHLLKYMGYTPSQSPESLEAFTHILRFHGNATEERFEELVFEEVRYAMQIISFEEGTLLRLTPYPESDKMLNLSAALDVIPWGILTVETENGKDLVVHSNPMAEAFLEIPNARMIGQTLSSILRIFGIEDDLSTFLNGSGISHYDHEGRKDNKVHWYRLHVIPYRLKKNYCLIVIEDTTERKIMEGQYFQSQRLEALGQLAGGVAHDFNNILSIIDGYARIARKKLGPETEAYGFMEHIASAVQRGSALTGQLLTFGRHKVVKDSVVDLGQLVRDQEMLLRPLMDASIALSIKTEDGVFVKVAPDNICQILLNTCINSRDAMTDGGNLIVEAQKEGEGHAVLRIIDTGSGMPSEVQAKMFDPFFTTKDQGKGTGLGLSMVYGLVKDMKGEIGVVSKENEGTAITIRLPLSEPPVDKHEIIEDEDGNVRLNGFTALVAEDEPDLLKIISSTLEDVGITVLRACNGHEALMVQDDYDGEIDFLLTDVVMPELNGVKLAELFESVRPHSQIMFMSGYPANGLMSRVPLPEGAVMMSKPIDMKKLICMIHSLAKNHGKDAKEKWSALTSQWRTA
ncbi:MAG: hypothetical protein DI551_04185 [Micavibrio aeruginosavorus]|uniref:histidine kinase n=1 Tax=Micavibrio aeruginosavorus TaxID=349221 RepID=A0A2W5PQK1_9BACT|nr:MAG: hypothetical protein DI551_04185 [Micavibrio aeruginosavorus]